MYKKLTMWFFFTIFAGILPLGFKWIICGMANIEFTYESICSEVFFFNLILSADGMKELYDVDSDKKMKMSLYCASIFIIICLSTFYGILLLNDHKPLDVNLENIYLYSKFATFFCVLTNLSIQIFGGANENA